MDRPSQRSADRPPFDYLDGWRGLAIVLLLADHFFPVPGINFGALGVNFFFVLSGWLMTHLLFVQLTPIDVFYRRRIARIVPAHLGLRDTRAKRTKAVSGESRLRKSPPLESFTLRLQLA